jgi:plastocyanin
MRKLLVSLFVVAALGVAAAQALAATRSVKIGDDFFVARGHHTVTVHKGTRVRWRNSGSSMHNVVVTKGPVHFRSGGYLFHGDTFSKKLRRTGTYRIICQVHAGMRMTIKVVR